MSRSERLEVAVTGCGWELPALGNPVDLARALADSAVSATPFAPEEKLGKKGLRYKEPATLMSLCSAKAALQDAGWIGADIERLDDTQFGVVVASNTGNLGTVCAAAETIRLAHVDATTPMDLPNASSNIVAATVAIRFGLKAINLLVCSGSSASLDALIMAANAIRNGRAHRMIVVATEADGLPLQSLLAQTGGAQVAHKPQRILEGSFAVVLEAAQHARQRSAPIYGVLGDYAYAHADSGHPHPLRSLLASHAGKRVYAPPSAATDLFCDPVFADAQAQLHLGPVAARAYGSAALLQLAHYCNCRERAAAESGEQCEGAVLVAGGMWGDRRLGALVMHAPSATSGAQHS
ncbi:beta-ketoacyl synthase N-terminal-like domain-containing protein [Paraburkholderia dilworthii]|uniref:beta-ketoacyl synthase N-terminal-like domain-containing protein n=1 Tax=Paraburkholderia dilworthii TaxID=948106 RepID=UPI0004032C6B|nr:beta-ketoacyl synthase N-terminal-like domain-containing protein [Paraburkholderia dilworthii]